MGCSNVRRTTWNNLQSFPDIDIRDHPCLLLHVAGKLPCQQGWTYFRERLLGAINMQKVNWRKSNTCCRLLLTANEEPPRSLSSRRFFSHLQIFNDNSVEKEIQRAILVGNRIYFAAISLFKNRFLSRATKILLYKTQIRRAVTYGAETWRWRRRKNKRAYFWKENI
jgi:hypothetical protein